MRVGAGSVHIVNRQMRALIPIGQQGALSGASTRRSEIVTSAFETLDQAQTMQFFRDYPVLFEECVQTHFPLDEGLVARFEDHWDWKKLASSTALAWSGDFIERFAERWGHLYWIRLSENASLPWTTDLIERYADRWSWWHLGWKPPFRAPLFVQATSICLGGRPIDLGWSSPIPWSDDLIERYADKWNWAWLSGNFGLPWSIELVERYCDKWDWDVLSRNPGLPWCGDLIDRYAEKWGRFLSQNSSLPWSVELIERSPDKWNWVWLSGNCGLCWSIDLIERYTDMWDWQRLSSNPGLPWNIGLIERYSSKWDWQSLGTNVGLPWNDALIERHADEWNWTFLSSNPRLPWSIDLLERYDGNWDWRSLSSNPGLPWAQSFFRRFQSNWVIESVGQLHHFDLPNLSEKQVTQLLEEIFPSATACSHLSPQGVPRAHPEPGSHRSNGESHRPRSRS